MKRSIIYLTVGVMLFVGFVMLFSRTERARQAVDPRDAAVAAGDYLVQHFHTDGGYFDYVYHPNDGTVSSSYNLLRHAGTTYALLELYGETKDERYRTVAEQALSFLSEQEKPCPTPHRSLTCLYEGDSAKLGGNALAILAFTEHARITGDATSIARAQTYAAWIVATQNAQGEFTAHERTEMGTTTDLVSEYYPGEAIFALMRLYALDHDERWQQAAERGARWLITVRDAGKATSTLPHDHWLLYGMNELHALRASSTYETHARKLVEAIGALQQVNPTDPDWRGGFYTPPRSTPTATRVEGLVAARTLLVRAGDVSTVAQIDTILDRAVPFLLRTQVTPARGVRLGFSDAARGGFTESLDEYDIRIDYVQHNISALLGYARIHPE